MAGGGTVRYNADGTLDSTYQFGGPGGFTGTSAAVGPQGTIYLLGYTGSDIDEGYSLLVLTPSGALQSPPMPVTSDDGSSLRLLALASGKLLIWSSGEYFAIGGSQTTAVVRLNADGSLDSSFNIGSGPNAQIYAVTELPDGQLLVGGYFSSFDNVASGPFARLNLNGTVDTTFSPANIGDYPGPFLVLRNGNILAWGGQSRTLFLLNPDGSVAQSLGAVAGASEEIYAMALQPNGQALVAGGFYSIGTVPEYNLARLSEDGTIDSTFDAGPALANAQATNVWRVAVQNNGQILYALNGAGAGRLNSDGSLDSTLFGSSLQAGRVLAVAASSDGRTFAVGEFTTVDGFGRMSVVAILPDGTVDPSFAPTSGLVWEDAANVTPAAQVAVGGDGSVYVAGTFTGAGNLPEPGIARFLPDGTLDQNFIPTLNPGGAFGAVAAMIDGRVAAGGAFSSVDGQPRSNIAAFDSGGTLDPAFASAGGTNAAVTLLTPLSTGGCFLGGPFTLLQNTRSDYVAALNGDGTVDAAFVSAALSSAPKGIAGTPDGRVLVATTSELLRLNAAGAVDLTYSIPNLVARVQSLTPSYSVQ